MSLAFQGAYEIPVSVGRKATSTVLTVQGSGRNSMGSVRTQSRLLTQPMAQEGAMEDKDLKNKESDRGGWGARRRCSR